MPICQTGCSSSSDCEPTLVCESVNAKSKYVEDDCPKLDIPAPGKSINVCLHPPIETAYTDNGNPDVRLGRCKGDCDWDHQCEQGLFCYKREEAFEEVPTCRGGKLDGSQTDVCAMDITYSERIHGKPLPPMPKRSPVCSPDCDVDCDCDGYLLCSHDVMLARDSGCTNLEGGNSIPVCTYPKLTSFGNSPVRTRLPYRACSGDCDNDVECGHGLKCLRRESRIQGSSIPGCVGKPDDDIEYCVPVSDDVLAPTEAPYSLPTVPRDDSSSGVGGRSVITTYIPGKLTVRKDQLLLSEGLDARLLATSDLPVLLGNGKWSKLRFHRRPDAAATFLNPDGSGGFVYVSNEEGPDINEGGVGAFYFDVDGKVLDYKMLLTNTRMNCGGGRSPWGTWITNEEYSGGRIWQVDPFQRREPQVTQVGRDRGWWESFAYDIRDKAQPRFFATEDAPNGALVRYSPSSEAVDWSDPWNILNDEGGAVEYLVLMKDEGGNSGTFRWTANREEARTSAKEVYPNTEGIDVRNDILYFVCTI